MTNKTYKEMTLMEKYNYIRDIVIGEEYCVIRQECGPIYPCTSDEELSGEIEDAIMYHYKGTILDDRDKEFIYDIVSHTRKDPILVYLRNDYMKHEYGNENI